MYKSMYVAGRISLKSEKEILFRVLGIYNFAHILKEVTMKRVVYKLTVASPALSHMFTDWEEDRRRILR